MSAKHLVILGTRGVPAKHGGFETFAEYLSLYLVERGWRVTVYCQEDGAGRVYHSAWGGIKRVHIPVKRTGPLGTMIFDLKSILHSLSKDGVFLTLGYNTAVFNVLHRIAGKTNLINMDGIEWKRQKWSALGKAWFWLNERFGCWLGNHLIADHPSIADHLATRIARKKITMIPYGGREVFAADEGILEEYGIRKNEYAILIARAEPENSILEVVTAFSSRKRNAKLVLLGGYEPLSNAYHREILDVASDEVVFLGAIYNSDKIDALRFFARFYIHGHQVGGTNPSLVESLGAGNAVLAHDNKFNRWVAQDSAIYFTDLPSLCFGIELLFNDDGLVGALSDEAKANFQERFRWADILRQYEDSLLKWIPTEDVVESADS
jgi:glycosyltransferase involved in cell wall biosynthesis